MSGLEILGAAASAFQLAQVGLATTRFLLQVQDTPKTIQTRVLQVQSLIEVARLISCKPQLQTAEIGSILDNCLPRANGLNEIIQGLLVDKKGSTIKKWTKSVEGAVVERKLLGLMQELEIDKTALVLQITSIDSLVLNPAFNLEIFSDTVLDLCFTELTSALKWSRVALRMLPMA